MVWKLLAQPELMLYHLRNNFFFIHTFENSNISNTSETKPNYNDMFYISFEIDINKNKSFHL